jgi:hypothetical protein
MANLPVGWASREFIHSLDGQRVDMTGHQERGDHHYLDGQKNGWPPRECIHPLDSQPVQASSKCITLLMTDQPIGWPSRK